MADEVIYGPEGDILVPADPGGSCRPRDCYSGDWTTTGFLSGS
jgi:hypothetical protein